VSSSLIIGEVFPSNGVLITFDLGSGEVLPSMGSLPPKSFGTGVNFA